MTKPNFGDKAGKYRFVPAGLLYQNHGGAGIYVKYGSFDNKIKVLELCSDYVRVQCPDRELLLVTGGVKAFSQYPTCGTYDEFVALSPFFDNSHGAMPLDFYMVNYTQAIGKESKSQNNRPGKATGPIAISDSGGFQLYSERLNYLDPKAIVEWYNKNVDIGLILDIPTDVMGQKIYRKLAHVQAKNTEIMVQHKSKDLELMNILHGATKRDRDYFRSVCERPDINRLAVGGAYYGSVLNSISYLYDAFTTGQKYKHYHVLGVANILQVLLLMRMSAYGVAPLITSDSSTFLQEAVSKKYHSHPHISEPPRYLQIGDERMAPSSRSELSCPCPVCATVKYSDVLGLINGNVTTFILMYHNMYSMLRYYNSMWEVISTATTKEIKQLLNFQLNSRRNGFQETIRGFDFLDSLFEHGIDHARTKYAYYLANDLVSYKASANTTDSLFSVDGSEINTETNSDDYSVVSADEIETEEDNPKYVNLQYILSHYDDGADAKHGEKRKHKMVAKGSSGKAAKGKKGPGGKLIKKKKTTEEKNTEAKLKDNLEKNKKLLLERKAKTAKGKSDANRKTDS